MEDNNTIMEQPKTVAMDSASAQQGLQTDLPSPKINDESMVATDDGSIGKFKSAESLLNAYNNLQAEFTRKCQKLSALEQAAEGASGSFDAEKFLQDNPQVVQQYLQQYLQEVQQNAVPRGISNAFGSGIPLIAPPQPKNLDEARELVKNLFK